jgi:hypothetical protein
MPDYPMLSTETVKVMKTNLDSLKKEIDNAAKAKDKKKAGELQKQYDQKCVPYCKKLEEDIAIAKKGCDAMTLEVENCHTQAMKSMTTAKNALNNYKKSRSGSDMTIIESAPGMLKTLDEMAQAEMNKYAVSWNLYREFNPGIDAKLSAKFNAVRSAIMDATKVYRQKQIKINTMIGEATALKAAGADASAMTLASGAEKVAEAEELLKTLNGMTGPFTAGKGSIENVNNNLAGFKTHCASPVNELKIKIKQVETQYSFTVANVQSFTTTLASMQKALATGKSTFHAMYLKDPKVAAALKKCDDLVAGWAVEVKNTQGIIAEMAKLLKGAQDRVKKGK